MRFERSLSIRYAVYRSLLEKFMKRWLAMGVTVVAAVACNSGTSGTDKDGVPIVDLHGSIVEVSPATVKDGWHVSAVRERRIKVGDQQMTLQKFLLTYCMGKSQNATCVRGTKIESIDGASGPQSSLPEGL
jgi:hypothetical protein